MSSYQRGFLLGLYSGVLVCMGFYYLGQTLGG